MEITNVAVLGSGGFYDFKESPPEFMDIAVDGTFNFDETDQIGVVTKAWPPF